MSSISWWSSYLKMKIWSGQNRANLHLCMTEKILSRMTIPALIIHHVVLAASLSKKRTKLIINVERMNAFVIFVLSAFFFMYRHRCMRGQGLETLFPKYITPHKAYDTNKVNICREFFLFPKENPKVYCSVCYGKIYWLFCVVAWNIFIRKLFTFKHFQFIRVHPSSFIPVGQNI